MQVGCVMEVDYYLKWMVVVISPIALFCLILVLFFIPMLICDRRDMSDTNK